jgi:hypothetical protein
VSVFGVARGGLQLPSCYWARASPPRRWSKASFSRFVAYLRALLEAVAAVVITVLIAAYVNGQLGASRNRG